MKFLVTVLLLLTFSLSYSQCIEQDKVTWGGDYPHSYIMFCPAYKFTYNGDTTKQWGIHDYININQIEEVIAPIKQSVEQEIKNYAGDSFFTRVAFQSVEVVYPDSVARFKTRQPPVIWDKCKTKYYFYYKFKPDSLANYNIGIAVDEQGDIISPFNFPSGKDYIPIDTSLTVCKVIGLAKKASRDIVPIEEVKFDYNPRTKRFYWIVSQEMLDVKEGINEFNQVVIDAANPKIIKTQIGKASVVF